MSKMRSVDRRSFLKGTAATGAAALVPGAVTSAAQGPASAAAEARTPAPAAPRETDPLVEVEAITTDRPGGDFMVDVLKSLDFEYVASNPGSSFRGIHESIINYGGNQKPEFLTCSTRNRRWRWPTATPRSRASRWRCCATARWACSTRRWRSTTPTATACRCSSWRATRSTRRCGGPASSGRTASRMRRRWSATSSSGTTTRCRCRTSPSRRCAPTRSP